jgi:hypothetical protein
MHMSPAANLIIIVMLCCKPVLTSSVWCVERTCKHMGLNSEQYQHMKMQHHGCWLAQWYQQWQWPQGDLQHCWLASHWAQLLLLLCLFCIVLRMPTVYLSISSL